MEYNKICYTPSFFWGGEELPVFNYANRGKAFENLIILANESYRQNRIAVIHKVPTEWLPIRGQNKKIASAKVDKKASVDFLGHIKGASNSLPIAFDAKEVSKGNRWPLNCLEEHQFEYLKDCALTGAVSFVLIGFWQYQRFFILPFNELQNRWKAWKQRTGPASVIIGEKGLLEVRFIDYLGHLRG
jgi:recombination protein U